MKKLKELRLLGIESWMIDRQRMRQREYKVDGWGRLLNGA